MKRNLTLLAFVSLGTFANAVLDMDHVKTTNTLISTPGFGVMQIFGDFPAFSGTVVDDFKASFGTVDKVGAAFELSNSSMNFANIKGWQVSFWNNPDDASNSGDLLNLNTAAQAFVPSGGAIAYTELFGTGAVGRTFQVDITLNLGVTAGNVYWVGMAPMLDFTNNGQTFLLSNTAPAILGNGTANNSVGVNPSDGFGLGKKIAVDTNAAYYVDTVPEPATLLALGAGLALLARRRR